MTTRALTDEERTRIAARYPSRNPVDVAIGTIAAVGLVATIGFVAWSGLIQSNPPVVAMVRSFSTTLESTSAEIVIQRTDPSQAATCFVHVQAPNYERVGELDLQVPPGTETLTVMDVEVKTVREGTAVSVENCRISG